MVDNQVSFQIKHCSQSSAAHLSCVSGDKQASLVLVHRLVAWQLLLVAWQLCSMLLVTKQLVIILVLTLVLTQHT